MAVDLSRPGTELTAALVDIPSVSGDEKRLADEVEQVLRAYDNLSLERIGNVLVARTELGRDHRRFGVMPRDNAVGNRSWTACPAALKRRSGGQASSERTAWGCRGEGWWGLPRWPFCRGLAGG